MSNQNQISVPDYAEREQAISPAGSFIVQAPAGSGKTELLIQRYLRLLSFVDHPEEIVAITFTRKAATEMENRIMQAIERVRLQVPPKNDATRLTGELAAAVLEQDAKQGWKLEQNPGRLRIQTIDALCASLTRQMPILSRFGAQPETLDDAGELYREAAANTLALLESGEHWSEHIAVLLTHLDNNLPKVRDMLAGMLKKRDQWLRHVAGDINRAELEAALRHIVESTLSHLRRSFPEKYVHEFLECLRYAAANMERDGHESLIRLCAGIDHLPGVTAVELPRWQAIAEICLTQQDEWRKQANVKIGFPAPGGSKAEKEAARIMKDRFQDLLAQLSGDTTLHELLMEVRYLPPYWYTDREWQVVHALCELLKLADAQLQLLCAERNQIDFSGITRAAITALESEGTPTDLALHLDYQIKHLLIDEFQDVSINQYDLVEKLIAGWSPGDGHTLFLVGDPMQSIYRFREAEVGLFIKTCEQQRLGQIPLASLRISVNFRSEAGVVDWVNEAFRQILPEQADSARGAVNYEPAIAFHAPGKGPAVHVHPLINSDASVEAEQVLQLVSTARPDQTTAILVRNRSHLAQIAPRLKQAGLQFRAVEIEELNQRPAIQDLLALTRALQHFADRIAWLAILRAPWCGLTLADLLQIGKDKNRTVWDGLQDEHCIQSLTDDGQQRVLKLRAVLHAHFAQERRRTLRRSVESVWISLGGPAALKDETDLINARTYFDLLQQFDTGGELKQRETFLEQVELLYAAPDIKATENPVEIMTIHKAKGLEFDTVILPGLHRKGRSDDAELLRWTENAEAERSDLLLAPIKEAGQDESPVYKFLKRLEQKRQTHEEGRLLYVAATRARKQLHLLATMKTSNKGELINPPENSLLKHLWPVVEARFRQEWSQSSSTAAGIQVETGTSGNVLRRLNSGWNLPHAPEPFRWQVETRSVDLPAAIPEYEWAGAAIRKVGTVVHRYIQCMAEEGLGKWNESFIVSRQPHYKQALKQLGVVNKDLDWASDSVMQALTKMINDERGRWILQSDHLDARNEYRVTGLHEGQIVNIVIDRTFVDENGARWIIDYKTSRHEGPDLEAFLNREQERYQQQLEKYADLMRNFDPRPIRAGLYFPLLQGWREF